VTVLFGIFQSFREPGSVVDIQKWFYGECKKTD